MPTAETREHAAPAAPAKKARRTKRNRQSGLLLQIATKVAAAETLDEILRYIVDVSVTQTEAERGTLFLNDERTNDYDSTRTTSSW